MAAKKKTTTRRKTVAKKPISNGSKTAKASAPSTNQVKKKTSNRGRGTTPEAQAAIEAHQFKKGNNLGGRPKGSRNKLSELFLKELHDDFEQHGVDAIKAVREQRPADYLKVVAKVIPQNFEIDFAPNTKIKVEFVN